MRKKFIILAIAAQIAALAFIAGEREIIYQTGTEIYLRTAPIDPRDMFRGDYVRLKYEISSLPFKKARGNLAAPKKEKTRGTEVYAVLKPGENNIAEVDYVTGSKPAEQLFIKGRLKYKWYMGPKPWAINADYGIEAYFVEQGQGRTMEKQRGQRRGIQIPLEMRIALSKNGTAVIKDHRWSKLGMGLKILKAGRRQNAKSGPVSSVMQLSLKNVSDAPLAIVDMANMCSFAMQPVSEVNVDLPLATDTCSNVTATDNDVITLAPGAEKKWTIDLNQRRWHVKKKGKEVETGALNWSERFRLIYQPPRATTSTQLRDNDNIWHGRLPSRAFHGRGRID